MFTPEIQQADFFTISARFYYKDQHMRFQILTRSENGGSHSLKEFDDYCAYTKAYDQLQLELMEQAREIFLPYEKEGTEKLA